MKYTFTHKEYMSDAEIADLFCQLEDNDMSGVVFYSGGVDKVEAFLGFVKAGQWLVRVDDENGETVGLFWLNGFQGRTAQFHFAIWRDKARDSICIGESTMKWLAGLDILDSLYGCTPKPYRHVVKYCRKLGFDTVCELPGACFMAKQDKHVPGVVSVLDLNKYKGN